VSRSRSVQEVEKRVGAQLVEAARLAVVFAAAGIRIHPFERRGGTGRGQAYAEEGGSAVAVGATGDVPVVDGLHGAAGGIWIDLEHGSAQSVAKLRRGQLGCLRDYIRGDDGGDRVVDGAEHVVEHPRAANVDFTN
jgi:hypothetical protein